MEDKVCHKTSIGGQAVIEGVMMRGPETSALAVRLPDGTIDVETWPTGPSKKRWYRRTPFVRGIFNMIDMLILGYRTLMKSADKAMIEEEPSAFEKKMQKVFGDKLYSIFGAIVMILGVALALGLFMVIPAFLVSLLRSVVPYRWILTAIEGISKIAIFVVYLYLVSKMKDIHRVFQYHGSEHKTIFCYENGEELTVENVRKFKRFHPRCGTSFMLFVLIVSILVNALVTWNNIWIRVIWKIILLPLVVGISYEIIKWAGRHDNVLTRILSAPGLWLQRFTTKEPDDSMIEVAIASMLPVIPENKEKDRW